MSRTLAPGSTKELARPLQHLASAFSIRHIVQHKAQRHDVKLLVVGGRQWPGHKILRLDARMLRVQIYPRDLKLRVQRDSIAGRQRSNFQNLEPPRRLHVALTQHASSRKPLKRHLRRITAARERLAGDAGLLVAFQATLLRLLCFDRFDGLLVSVFDSFGAGFFEGE